MDYKISAKGGQLYVNGKRVGQVIVPTFERIPEYVKVEIPEMNPTDIINKNVITYEDFKEIIKSGDYYRLLYFPLYSKVFRGNKFFSSRIKGTPIPFDFIQVQGKVLIYADGDDVRIIGEIDDDVEYYLMTRGIVIGNISRYGSLSRNQRANVTVDSDELWLFEVVEKYLDGKLVERDNELILIVDDSEYKIIREGNIFGVDGVNIPKVIVDNLERGFYFNDKIYGAEFKSVPVLDFMDGKLYFMGYEIVCDYSIHNNMIKTTKVQRVKIRHSFKSFRIVSMSDSYFVVLYKDSVEFINKELPELVRFKKFIRVKPTDNTKMIIEYIEKNGLDFYFIKCSNNGVVYYQFINDVMYIVGDGVCELEHVYDKKHKLIYVKNRRKVYRLKKIDSIMEVDEIILNMS